MPVAKLKASSTPDVMETEEGNDSLDTIIRQAIGKEPFLSFSRAGDSPVQWIQLLHALDQQELPGWPLISPLKVQLQKCDKCSREFCSPINYRRHIRAHHRLKKLDKDYTKNQDLLRAYWDKLTVEEAKEVVSFKNVMLEDVSGSSIIKAMTNVIRKPGFSSLPQYYLRAGSALIDIVQGRSSRFPISSQEFFSILDDASEKTFLCGTAELMQKYIFDGEAGKIGLETKNLVACTGFLVEQNLVKAWLADKDAEALRCQKLLVEEEEAARKRQADILERKREKKLRQKEQKAKEQRQDEQAEVKESGSTMVVALPLPEESNLSVACNFESHTPDAFPDEMSSYLEPIQCPNNDGGEDCDSQPGLDCESADPSTDQNFERQTAQGPARHRIAVARRPVLPRSQWNVSNGFHANHNSQISKLGGIQKHGPLRNHWAAPVVNGNKVWSRKPKPEIGCMVPKGRLQEEPMNQLDQMNGKVLIGSISVTLGNCSQPEGNLAGPRDNCLVEIQPKQSKVHDKPLRSDSVQNGLNKLTVKLWRPVGQHGKGPMPVQNGSGEASVDMHGGKGDNQPLPSENCSRFSDVDNDNSSSWKNSTLLDRSLAPGSWRASIDAAKSFLAQRWKEAISSDHVNLILYPDSDPAGCSGHSTASQSSNFDTSGYANIELVNKKSGPECEASGAFKSKLRVKPEKGFKIKYIPKQKTVTE